MNVKHRPLLCIFKNIFLSSNATMVTFISRRKRKYQQCTKSIQFSATWRWATPVAWLDNSFDYWALFPYFEFRWSRKKVCLYAYLMPFRFGRTLLLDVWVLNVQYSASVLSVSCQNVIEYIVPNSYCLLLNHKNKRHSRKRHHNRCLSLKCSIFSIYIVFKLSKRDRLYI